MLLVGFIARRFRGAQPAYAPAARRAEPGPGTYSNVGYGTAPAPMQRTVVDATGGARPGSAMDQFSRGAPAASVPWEVPAGFDTAAFLVRAKENFIRLQRAWDRGDLEEMSDFTTNDLFITLTHDLRARGGRTPPSWRHLGRVPATPARWQGRFRRPRRPGCVSITSHLISSGQPLLLMRSNET